MDRKRETFINAFKSCGGIVAVACESIGISRKTYYNWRADDPEFAAACDEILELQIDFVESKLLDNIKAGDTKAIMFYLRTKGRKRGYADREPQQQQPQQPELLALPPAPSQDSDSMKRLVKNKKDYLVRVLKKQGKYSAELTVQVTLAAKLLVRSEMLEQEMFEAGYSSVNVEISREGNKRESISPRERLYMDLLAQTQKALQALGMNADSKAAPTQETSPLAEFYKDMERDD